MICCNHSIMLIVNVYSNEILYYMHIAQHIGDAHGTLKTICYRQCSVGLAHHKPQEQFFKWSPKIKYKCFQKHFTQHLLADKYFIEFKYIHKHT